MKFFDVKSKNPNILKRNYFFATTFIVVLINVLVYVIADGYVEIQGSGSETDLSALFQGIINSYNHANPQHIALNMLCFVICGIYIERKFGTYCFTLLMLVLTIVSEGFVTILWTDYSIGFSGINYAIYGFIFVNFILCIFNWRKKEYGKLEIAFDIGIIAMIYLAMCFSGGTSTFEFKPYPYDLIAHGGHFAGFIAGLIIGFITLAIIIYNKYTLKCSLDNE